MGGALKTLHISLAAHQSHWQVPRHGLRDDGQILTASPTKLHIFTICGGILGTVHKESLTSNGRKA
jgi:hypothetical protein